ncbi:hypothetical protein [Maribacter sp. 2307UL18-2]|uniref:hypothetical protein n=1 Tax=Maribacter sp. 2307UL18-2 TaxID=3386274 RepID=UPI0039BCFD7F
MKLIISFTILCTVILFSCTDRDDNLEGVQIRVQNTTETTFSEVVIDSLLFQDLQPEEIAFYQKYDSLVLPRSVALKTDSLDFSIAVDTMLELDSVKLHLFTYRIKRSLEDETLEIEILKD